jgi:hypothetical protein
MSREKENFMQFGLSILNTSQYHDHPCTFIDLVLKDAKSGQPISRSSITIRSFLL